MKKIDASKMLQINGGTRLMAKMAGGACALSMAWPIGTAIFGPTCLGLVIGTIMD